MGDDPYFYERFLRRIGDLPLKYRAWEYGTLVYIGRYPNIAAVAQDVSAARRAYAERERLRINLQLGERREAYKAGRRAAALQRLIPPGPCAYCGVPDARSIDHVMPRSRGGSDAPHNLVRACRSCNGRKGNRTPEEWRAGVSPSNFYRRREAS